MASKERLFKDAGSGEEASEIESLCLNCHKNGTTRLLLTRIPMFREIVLMSFSCPHCGWTNNEVQSAETIGDRGCKIVLKATRKEDLSRQVVRTETATVTIPELELEIPAKTQKGDVTTVESILMKVTTDLEKEQPLRKAIDIDAYEKIESFIQRVKECQSVEREFTLIVDDPSGNSFVENPLAPQPDPQLQLIYYNRTKDQDEFLGIFPAEEEETEVAEGNTISRDEVLVLPGICPSCQSAAQNRMKTVDIPHFKEVIIMALTCDNCGYKSNEVKSGGGVAEKGSRLELTLTIIEDLSRDVLKSETASVVIPAMDLEIQSRSVGGRFTTIEGLVVEIRDELKNLHPFGFGDSAVGSIHEKLQSAANQLDRIATGEWMVKIVIDDPAGNSYIQNYYAPDPDPNLNVLAYERTKEQNEELGITDMMTEDSPE
ncbi:zinc finger protein ZPR1-like [Oscarella lobularis]|uniref:zinc finger protein ZPR1-like n=1 Tax=Oscarella lobularis TaxID=121494 RepID=UPI0033132980